MSLFRPSFDLKPYTRTGQKLRELAFPLGGIGTGCVSLDGRGGLVDWEIYGRPNKGCSFEYTFPALWFQEEGKDPRALRLLGPRQRDWVGEREGFWSMGHGRFFKQMDGLPGFPAVEYAGTFPMARLHFVREDIPLKVELAAFNPFIPLDVRSTSFPGALMIYRLENTGDRPIEASIAWSLMNPVGQGAPEGEDKARADRWQGEHAKGICFGNDRFDPHDPLAGEFVLATDWADVDICERWTDEGWWDSVRTFWAHFRNDGHLGPIGEPKDKRLPGSIACRASLAPGESVEIPFAIIWRFPNADKYWENKNKERAQWQAHYATVWPSAASAADELLSRRTELTDRTLAFEDALYQSSLPQPILESVGATLNVLHSPTLIRLENGEFWAWEGCSPNSGCCDGTCSHVWNYALSHAYLFPEIERSFLDVAFAHTFPRTPAGEQGAMVFRVPIPLGVEANLWHAASDGQLGQIIQIYRTWRLTGDGTWLRSIYRHAKRALGYAWVQWDRDQDGLVDGDMHNTYDINFQGPNPLTQFFYLGALRAMTAMAAEVGDAQFGDQCTRLAEKGSALAMERLWTGEFFRQLGDFTSPEAERYQHGAGCLTDQIFGQLAATVAGLGDLVPSDAMGQALDAIFRHNFRSPLGDHENLQRVYGMEDEAGLLMCSWPDGEMPAYPFPYSDELWTGCEYMVASHLLYAGRETEALAIVDAIRNRYDGERRNPWNEFECGSHYARALSSYGMLLAITDARYDATTKTLTFTKAPFQALWSTPHAWGTAHRHQDGHLDLKIIEGTLPEGTTVS